MRCRKQHDRHPTLQPSPPQIIQGRICGKPWWAAAGGAQGSEHDPATAQQPQITTVNEPSGEAGPGEGKVVGTSTHPKGLWGHQPLPRAAPVQGNVTQSTTFRRKLLEKNYFFREQFMPVSSPLTPSSSQGPSQVHGGQRSHRVSHFGCSSPFPNQGFKGQKSQMQKKLNPKTQTNRPFPLPVIYCHTRKPFPESRFLKKLLKKKINSLSDLFVLLKVRFPILTVSLCI